MYSQCLTPFSLCYGTLPVDRWMALAQQYQIKTLAIVDILGSSAHASAWKAAKKAGVHVVFGTQIWNDGTHLYSLLARNATGYASINRFLSEHVESNTPFPQRAPAHLPHTWVIYPFAHYPTHPNSNELLGLTTADLALLPQRTYLRERKAQWILHHPMAFETTTDYRAHKLLRAIHYNELVTKLQPHHMAPAHHRFMPPQELRKILQNFDCEFLEDQTEALLQACECPFDAPLPTNKKSFTGNPIRDFEMLKNLAFQGLKERYAGRANEALPRLKKELETIHQLGFSSYFLINWDLIQYARRRGFFHVGRGSGANSLAAYCLYITDVDPIELDLYFERFINPHRASPPDFDIDFSWKDRDEMFQYLFDTYGKDRVALLGAYVTFQHRAVLRELGKAVGLPPAEIEELQEEKTPPKPEQAKLHQTLRFFAQYLHNFPHQRSIHACGVLISEGPIYQHTATFLPPKGFPVTQFSMLEAEDVGLFKYDILSQRGLGHIKDAVELIQENRGVSVNIHQIEAFKNDPQVAELLSKGATMGCFYVESPAMRMLLSKLHCTDYLTLVAASSVIRPGVSRSGMMQAYIERHRLPERRADAHPVMQELMPETYGIMVYQEDVMKVAHLFAGLGLDECDVLRRGMSGKFRSKEEFQRVKDSFFRHCTNKNRPPDLAQEVWHQIESFAGYSFAKGHSASFAVESYQSMYLKAHFPLEFLTAVINNFGGFYHAEFYLHEAKRYGAKVEAPCVNESWSLTRLQGTTIWLGFGLIQGLEEKSLIRIMEARKQGAFVGLADFLSRTDLSVEQTSLLVRVGAFRFSELPKQTLLWQVHSSARKTSKKPSVATASAGLFHPEEPNTDGLPPWECSPHSDAWDELELLGFTLEAPFPLLQTAPVGKAADLLKNVGRSFRIVGQLVTIKPTRTVKGQRMFFGTFLDQNGDWIDTVHFPPVAAKFPFRGQGCYLLEGRVTQEFNFPTLEVFRMEKCAWK